MTVDKLESHNCMFRATYLIKVPDCFADELQRFAGKPTMSPVRFRSQVLNPILQRQRQGVYDHEPGMVKVDAGETLSAAAAYYLKVDPLEPRRIDDLRRAILY
jgi:hypothetical protein